MAPLTWRNVDAPDLSKASQILNQSATMLGNAGEGISGTLTDIRNRQRRDRSAAVLPELAKVANEQGVAGALAQMGSMISPQDMTPELQEAMMNLRGNALGYESSRAATTSIRDSNNRQQQTHDIGIQRDNQLAATTPALVDAMLRSQGRGDQGPQAAPSPAGGGDYPIGVPVNGPASTASEKYSTGVAVDPWESRKDVQAGIFAGESGGDYNALFGYSNQAGGRYAGQKLTDMSVSQALDFSAPSGDYGQWVKGQVGRVATPMGAYQIVGSTLREAVKAGIVRPDEKFTEAVQDRVGAWILETQGTGAWEGYRGPGQPGQNGSGSRGPVDLFSMIPPGTSIRPQDIFPQLINLQDAQETSFNRRDTNEDRALAAEERAKTAEEERIQREALSYVQTQWGGFGPDPQETLNQIYADQTLSVEQKTAYGDAVKKFYENNAGNFDLPTDVATPNGVNNEAQDISAYVDYMKTTSPSAQVFAAANNTEDTRAPLEIMAGVQEALGENYEFNVPNAVGIVNDIASEYSLDARLVGRVAETMIKEGGLIGADLKLDEAQLREKLAQTFKSGGDYQQEVELQASLEEMQTQAANYQQRIQEIQQRRAYWEEPGRDPEKADAALIKLDDQLDAAIKSLQSLGNRARTQRDDFDKARGVGRPETTTTTTAATSATPAGSQVQRWLEEQMLSEIAAGDPVAIEEAEKALIAQGVDPRVAKNSTMLRELIKTGVVSLVQWTDNAVGDAAALTGRVLEGAGRAGAYAYGTVDPQGASKALQLLDEFGGSMDRLAEEGYIPDGNAPRTATAPAPEPSRSEGNNEARVTYQQWRQMSRSERKKAGLPVSELGGQFYFSRFGDGFQ